MWTFIVEMYDSGSRDWVCGATNPMARPKGQQLLKKKKKDPFSELTASSERKLDVFVQMLLWDSVGRSARQSAHANR